jgi:hypothetical protein
MNVRAVRQQLLLAIGAVLISACGGAGGSDFIAYGIELSATDLGGGRFIVRITGQDLAAAAVQGLSLEVVVESESGAPIQYDQSLSSTGPFFDGGQFAANFGQADPTVLFVGAGLLPDFTPAAVDTPLEILVLGFQLNGLQSGDEDTINFTLQSLSLFAKDPVGGFPVEVPPQSYVAETFLSLEIVI